MFVLIRPMLPFFFSVLHLEVVLTDRQNVINEAEFSIPVGPNYLEFNCKKMGFSQNS